MDIDQKKERLREQLLNQRESIPQEKYRLASDSIIRRLQEQSEYSAVKTVHCYVSMNGRREVDTHGLIKKMLSGDKRVIVPVTDFNEYTLSHVNLTSFDMLETNKWGVLEPPSGEEISADEMELVIVPMVGADEQGNRIGYGKGFYDRFLKEVNCPKVGLIFEQNVVEEVPSGKYDIPLDKIITEHRVICRE